MHLNKIKKSDVKGKVNILFNLNAEWPRVEDDLYDALKMQSLSVIDSGGGRKGWLITDDFTSINSLREITSIVKELQKDNDPLFTIRKANGGKDRVHCCKGKVGSRLLNFIVDAKYRVKRHFPYHDFDPRVELFYLTLEQRPQLVQMLRCGINTFEGEDAFELVFRLNDFVSKIREDLGSEWFRDQTRKCKRAALKNWRGFDRYTSSLFCRYARILIVRIDLYHRKPELQISEGGNISREQVVNDRNLYFRGMEGNSLYEHLIGYAWKLEYGLKKGYHYHCFLFFDGSKVRQDVTLARMAGEDWIRVTRDKGDYWNCNADKDRYRGLGIGMIAHDDTAGRSGLNRAIAYVTKPDYCLCLQKQDIGRNFARGVIKPIAQNRPGRRRRSG